MNSMETKVYQITKWSLIKGLIESIILFALIITLYFSYTNIDYQSLLILSPFILFSLYPMIIFIYHYKHDKNIKMEVIFDQKGDKEFSFINYIVNEEIKQTFYYNDIVCRYTYTNIYILSSYYYIELRDQEPIIISSLLTNLSNVFDGVGLKSEKIWTINLIPSEIRNNK